MYCIWLLPSWIDLDRYNEALAKALSLVPTVAGRMCQFPDEGKNKGDVYIKLTNDAIPVTVVDDYHTDRFPLTHVGESLFRLALIRQQVLIYLLIFYPVHPQEDFDPWVDAIPSLELINNDEPLGRVKFTRLHKTGQMVYATSWSHGLGLSF